MIAENLEQIRERIAAACGRAGRDPAEVTLIAVSKTRPAEDVRTAFAAGQKDFGENKAQEMAAKAEETGDGPRWHFIGNLQRNKVKYVVGRAVLIHSLSGPELADEIERVSAKRDVVTPVLIEVNIGGEETKGGPAEEEAEALVRKAASLPHLKVRGLMTVVPPAEDPEDNRPYFRRMRSLAAEIAGKGIPGVSMDVLSMGMSGDFETAVEEGATMVRVGTAILGERDYSLRK